MWPTPLGDDTILIMFDFVKEISFNVLFVLFVCHRFIVVFQS